ncbi:MAG: DNA mismatch repair endonuclease MutL [Bacteroidales bacterium]|nr:DNA mismatch repair endonuclease MutL [Bacteroidales bacterium]MDY6074814.1 DNA mismatch repair endonuclease MutL [Bacteroidales bacterium]
MDIIKLLPDSVANQIAAGEVIQRPASVVKELMENAIDAGATQVDLVVRDAGRTLISVADNGCGMSETDARLCFERHATSKIRCADDLFSIRTMGFRGEALASIAAVAQVELSTRRKEDNVGTKIRIEGSKVLEQSPKPMSAGSSFMVKNLFFNVPARRNFLKSNDAELRHINDEFFRVTMMNPQVGFSYISNDKELFHLYPGTLKQRIVGLFGKDYDSKLLPVNQVTESVAINGFIVKPEFLKKTRGEQYFFVNSRFIKHSYLHHAVENAYKELIPQDCFPGYFLDIQIDPKEIDINIHPTKTEVNFIDIKLIYAIMHSAVRKAIGQNNLAPMLDFDIDPNLGIDFGEASRMDRPLVQPKVDFNPSFNPFKVTPIHHQNKNWRIAYDTSGDVVGNSVPDKSDNASDVLSDDSRSLFIQLQQSYIVTAVKSGLLVVDQNLAHQRILYEKYLREMDNSSNASQQELFPQHVSLNVNDASILRNIKPELERIGFRLEEMNPYTFIINGTPTDCKGTDAVSVIERIIDDYKTCAVVGVSERKLSLARSLAAQMAVKPGQPLNACEMQDIIDRLFGCAVSEIAPNGKKIFTIIHSDEIKNRFANGK